MQATDLCSSNIWSEKAWSLPQKNRNTNTRKRAWLGCRDLDSVQTHRGQAGAPGESISSPGISAHPAVKARQWVHFHSEAQGHYMVTNSNHDMRHGAGVISIPQWYEILCRFWCWTRWLYFWSIVPLDLHLSYKAPSLICNLETELNMHFIRNYRYKQVHKIYNLSSFSFRVSATEISA